MKKTFIFTLLISTSPITIASNAGTFGNWMSFVIADDFTDKTSCAITNLNGKSSPSFTFFIRHSSTEPHAFAYSRGSLIGAGIKYRIDKGEVIQFGKMNKSRNLQSIFLTSDDLEKVISDFKAGNKVAVEVNPKNQFSDKTRNVISLSGFTKAYESCI